MSKKINISFKNTNEDMDLYMKLMSQREKSNFIKTAIEFYFKHLECQDSIQLRK